MLRIARSRRALSGMAFAILLTASIATPAVAGDEVIVQRGDTLWDIALRHGTTLAALVTLNQIENPSVIRIGQRIVLRLPPATAPTLAATPPASWDPMIYVVRPGDTLWDIAVRHGSTVAALAELNRLTNPSLIRIGQALAIPQTATPPAASPISSPAAPALARVVHTVQAGETLWVISGRYGVSIQSIVEANQLASASFIRTSQQLVIPIATGAPASDPSMTTAGMPADMAAKVAARTAARDVLLAAAREFGVPAALVLAVSWHESGWQPDVVSPAGAVGLMQLVPDTADWVADTMLHEASAIDDALWNARAGVRLLSFYLARYQGSKAKTLAAYFQGMGSVDEIGILASSLPYIDSILALEVMFSR
jgi:LysM repeat protein